MNQSNVIYFILILLAGCSDMPPPEHLEPDLFVRIYTEAIIQSLDPAKQDSLSHLNNALLKYEITKEEFDQNVAYYRGNPELWSDIFTKITAEFETRKAKEQSLAQ